MSLPSPVPLRKDKKIIPKDELMFWVENNVNTDGVNIVKIRDAHLWTVGDYDISFVLTFSRSITQRVKESFAGLIELESVVISCTTILAAKQ